MTGEKFILIGRNELYVTSKDHNLLPTFIMSEAGIEMNDKAKIHCNKPTKNDNATIDKEMVMHICLYIDNTFSIFRSSKLTIDEIYDPNIGYRW